MKIRGFEILEKYKDSGINLPKRMTENAAGYDIEAAENVEIRSGEITLIPTGLKSYMLNDEVLYLYNRSSFPKKRGLVLANAVGVIDADYYNNPDNEGHIFAQMKNISDHKVEIAKGERIAQAVFAKILLVDDDENEAKFSRKGGFGSTK